MSEQFWFLSFIEFQWMMQVSLQACTVPGSEAKEAKLRLLETSPSGLLRKVLRQKTGANFLTKSTKKNKNFFE